MLIRSLDWCTWHRFLIPGYPGNEFTFVHNANNADNDPTTAIMDRRVTGNSTVYSHANDGDLFTISPLL